MRHPGGHLLLLLLSLLLSLAPVAAAETASKAGAAAEVLIVPSERGGAYEETIDILLTELGGLQPSPSIEVRQWDEAVPAATTRVIVTIGAKAAAEVGTGAEASVVVNTLLPSHSFAQIHSGRSADEMKRITAVFLDQPVRRQIALLREALPDWTNLALISGPTTRELSMAIETEARQSGLSVRRSDINSDRELFRALQQTLESPALLIAVPDRDLYNSRTIQNILLTSYRRNSPLVGFSAAYVRAGALLAVYSHPAQVAAQAAEAVAAVLHGNAMPPPRYPVAFEVDINQTVARSLGIRLNSARVIEARLRLLEGGGERD